MIDLENLSTIDQIEHEIRNPLAIILGNIYLIKNRKADISQERLDMMADSIGEQVHRIESFVKSLRVKK